MSTLTALWAIFLDRLDEHRWSRQIAYVAGPTCIQYSVDPVSHDDNWPMKRADNRPMVRVMKALEAAKPSNIRTIREKQS